MVTPKPNNELAEGRVVRPFSMNFRMSEREHKALEAVALRLFGGNDRGSRSNAIRYLIQQESIRGLG